MKSEPGILALSFSRTPECPPEVLNEADFAGSTAAMSGYVTQNQPHNVVLITECSMSDNVAAENPEVNFIRPCNLCPHMKRISLEAILHALETMTHEVHVDDAIADKARLAVQRMIDLPPTGKVSDFTVNAGNDVIAVEQR